MSTQLNTLAGLKAEVSQLNAVFSAAAEKPRDKSWVCQKLAHMRRIDQLVRKHHTSLIFAQNPTCSDEEKESYARAYLRFWIETDKTHTRELKKLCRVWGWFSQSNFGAQAPFDAWLIAQHADHDPRFQAQVLKKIEPLFKQGEVPSMTYAYLYDRVAVNSNQLHRYGTQISFENGEPRPAPVEQPEKLDERRKSVGLEPVATYLKSFKPVCSSPPPP